MGSCPFMGMCPVGFSRAMLLCSVARPPPDNLAAVPWFSQGLCSWEPWCGLYQTTTLLLLLYCSRAELMEISNGRGCETFIITPSRMLNNINKCNDQNTHALLSCELRHCNLSSLRHLLLIKVGGSSNCKHRCMFPPA